MPSFSSKLNELQTVLHAQGDRVLTLVTLAIESYFDHDEAKARTVVALDDEIDTVDVAIERASIPLLAMGQTNEHAIRQVLTLVKVNNESLIVESTLQNKSSGINIYLTQCRQHSA